MSDKKKHTARLPFIIFICLLLLAAFAVNQGWFSDLFRPDRVPGSPESTQAVIQEKALLKEPATEGLLPAGPMSSPPTEQQQEGKIDESSCENTAAALHSFFNHLDQQEYVRAYHLPDNSAKQLNNIAYKLFANPPFVTNETGDLFNILNNMTHIFRIIGKQDISFLKDILEHEKEIIETVMVTYYQWHSLGQACREKKPNNQDVSTLIALPLAGLYEYASFFLNTLGGQSYLLRRQPRLRVLIKYYSVLILDQANMESMNRHGVDIRYPINSLIGEIESVRGLLYAEEYLLKLYDLQEKYGLQELTAH